MRRRAFVRRTPGVLALPTLLASDLWPQLTVAVGRPQDLPSLDGKTVINALGGLSNPNTRTVGDASGGIARDRAGGPDPRAVQDAVASGLSAVNVTVGYVAGDMDPFEHTVAEVARWARWAREDPSLALVLRGPDIDLAKSSGQVGIILGFQNCAMIADRLERVDTFADMGVRVTQLTYNVRNQIGDGSMEPENRGLTPLGYEILERLQARRLLVDLSHSGERTCLDAARAARSPLAITHTGCRALTDLPRNKTDAELRAVADAGGVVGIYFMPFLKPSGNASAEDVIQHIEHAIQVCGEDHVGIGTDGGTTGVDDMDAFRAVIRAEVGERAAAGIGATGESDDVIPMVEDLQGPDQFRKLAALLRARGHEWSRIDKVLGENFHRLMADVWS
ncbi:MAG: peptidase M19 [Gemmatimonadetes bacterium]|nr:peptidase M19 [Gemmatimonadota bacterium]